ncbi:MAG: hypothetical protein RLZZ308_222 [Candidatus Parcubacteria bacterium]
MKITVGVVIAFASAVILLAYILQPKSSATEKTISETTGQQASTTSATSKELTHTMDTKTYTNAVITTNKGVIEIAFATNTPVTVENFTKLASSHFYEGVRFHRVIKDFMIQGGDPLSKEMDKKSVWGTGGPGYRFNDELTGSEQYTLGTVAMANAGPNTNGSQFFIVTANPGVGLPPSYTVFGKVVKGLEVALAIQEVKTNGQDQPLEDVIIENVELQ